MRLIIAWALLAIAGLTPVGSPAALTAPAALSDDLAQWSRRYGIWQGAGPGGDVENVYEPAFHGEILGTLQHAAGRASRQSDAI